MNLKTFLMTGVASLALATTANTTVLPAKTFVLSMYKVAQTDNLDKMDALGSDKADLYVMLWINGKDMGKTENISTDVGETNWRRNLSSYSRYVKFRIRMMEDDGGLEGKDDHVDINPRAGKKDLDFTYDTWTGRISGDVNSKRGMNIHMAGEGDSDRGQLWFKIE